MKRVVSLFLSVIMLLTCVMGFSINAFAAAKIDVSCAKTMYTGNTETVTVKLGGKKASASKCSFSSNNKSVATISSKGVITVKKAGKVKITVSQKSKKSVKKTVSITVKKNQITSPAYTYTFAKGSKYGLTVYYKGERVKKAALYKSSNTKVATVSADGTVTAKKAGTAVISVTPKKDKNMIRRFTINVVDRDSSGVFRFSVSPSSVPLNGNGLNFSTYNSNTKTYYLLRSYLEFFEKNGGGYLYLQGGTYYLPTSLGIPSNTTIECAPNVVIQKTYYTGHKDIGVSNSLFQLCAQSKLQTNGAYSGYNGVQNVKFIGNGATIDMGSNDTTSLAFVLCHNQNVEFSGINFQNIKNGHFFEIDATNNVLISGCTFKNQKPADVYSVKECINLDTPDKKTNGFGHPWTSYDCTPNNNIVISNNTFDNVQVGIGTHMYTANKYHSNIQILNNGFYSCRLYGIRALNWKDSAITSNIFNGVGYNTNGAKLDSNMDQYGKTRVLYLAGCDAVNIVNNDFSNFSYAVQFKPFESVYSETNNNRAYYTNEKLTEIANTNYYHNSISTKKAECPELRYFDSQDTSATTFKTAFAVK